MKEEGFDNKKETEDKKDDKNQPKTKENQLFIELVD